MVDIYFPSFSEGLSLRRGAGGLHERARLEFPFLFGGTFIEACGSPIFRGQDRAFPFLFGGTFIEAQAQDSVI